MSLPSYSRLLRQLESLEEPVILVWGWPGTGKRRFLRALADDPRVPSQVLLPGEAAEPGRLEERIVQASAWGVRWLLWDGSVPGTWKPAISHLRPHQSLVVTTSIRYSVEECAAIAMDPRDLLLDEEESQALWFEVTGARLTPRELAGLHRATEGWLRPLLVLAEAAREQPSLPQEEIRAEAVPGLFGFLRDRVFEPMGVAEQETLLELSLSESHSVSALREAWVGSDDLRRGLQSLIGRVGLVCEREGEVRLPRILHRFVEAQRTRQWSAKATREARVRLGQANADQGRPDRALMQFLAAEDDSRVRTLVEAQWLRLLASTPMLTLQDAVARVPSTSRSATFRFLHDLLVSLALPYEARGWPSRERSGASEVGGEEVLDAVQTLFSALLDLGVSTVESRWPDWQSWHDVSAPFPPPMRGLGYLGEAVWRWSRGQPKADGPARDLFARALKIGSRPLGTSSSKVPPSVVEEVFRLALGRCCRRWPELVPLVTEAWEGAPDLGLAGSTEGLPSRVGGRNLAAISEPARSAASKPGYRLVLFGDPALHYRAEDGSYRELRWPLRRAFKILAYVASAPDLRVGRDELVAALWSAGDEEAIRKNFHPTVSLLRRSLERTVPHDSPTLLFQNGTYLLNPELRWEVDVVQFEERIQRGKACCVDGDPAVVLAEWEGAWKLHRGAFLQGHDDPWVIARRDELRRLYVELLRQLGDRYVGLEQLTEAEDAYRSALIEDPLQENVYVAIMEVYARRGRRDLVRRQYERLGKLLQEELGVEPRPTTSAEYHRLMS